MSEIDQCLGCGATASDTALLIAQSRSQLDQAYNWMQRKNLNAAEAFLDTARKLLVLSDDAETTSPSDIWARYHTTRGIVAEQRKMFHAALRHHRLALNVVQRLYPDDNYKVLTVLIIIGTCLVSLGDKDKGRAMIAANLQKLKEADFSNETGMLKWRDAQVKIFTEFLDEMDRSSRSRLN